MINAGVIGYAICAVVFLILTFLLAVGARAGWQGRSVLLASFVTFAWSVFASAQASTENLDNIYLSILELLRMGSWLLFLIVLLVNARFTGRVKKFLLLSGKVVLSVLICLCLYMFLYELGVLIYTPLLDFTNLISIRLIVVVVCLIFVEQLFRHSHPESRWAVKFLFFGIGGMFFYDFYFYTDALIFNMVDVDIWNTRGFVNAIAVPFIAMSIIRNKGWSIDIFVSRELVFNGAAVIGVGFYLLLMATGGYYIRTYGGGLGGVAQLAFFFGASGLLFILMFSAKMRARLRVFIVKHFRHYKYDYREEWLRIIRLLSTKQVRQELQENSIRVLADIVESSEAGLWVRDEAGVYNAVATWNMDVFEKYSEKDFSSMLKFLHQWQWVIDLDEYVEVPDLYQDLELPDWIEGETKFWLIVPLMLQTKIYGFVILGHSRVPIRIGWEERDLLLTAGRQITSYFALMDMDEALAETRQFEAFNRLSAYVVHDLKNIVAQLSLVVSNAGKHKDNPVFKEDAVDTVENAVEKMSKMLSHLRKGHLENVHQENVYLDDLLHEVVIHREHDKPQPLLITNRTGITLLADRERFGAVLEHLVQNAQEATPDIGKVEIRLSGTEKQAVIEIIDNGCGMDKQFIRERLFKPFDTTKGNAGMGIGVYESREFIHSLGGSLKVESEPGQGTTFKITLSLGDESSLAKVGVLQGEVI
jgi:putative PEP-CTERM system histidine kinase